jgi:hypothetical protein
VDYAALVRYFLPFCAALQGFVILHASAVSCNDHGLAFIGASGSGKSTIAKHLRFASFHCLADDLLPITVGGGGISLFGTSSAELPRKELPLKALYFLERDPGLDKPVFVRLQEQDALLALLNHGYGEMPDTAVWRTQFIAYSRLAREVSAFSMRLPDNRTRLPETMQEVAQELRQLDRTYAAHPVEITQ